MKYKDWVGVGGVCVIARYYYSRIAKKKVHEETIRDKAREDSDKGKRDKKENTTAFTYVR